MTRSSPAVDRVAAVLHHVSSRPDENFSISELSRRLDISKATCHALIGSLLNAHFLQRDPTTMRVSVGPALVAIGAAAASRPLQLVELATDEMRYLATKYEAQCGATHVVGDEIVVMATVGTPGSFETSLHVGQRIPLQPPLGPIHVAWANDEIRQNWINHRHPSDGIPYGKVLSLIRERGFSVALEIDRRLRVEELIRQLQTGPSPEDISATVQEMLSTLALEEYFVFDIYDDTDYDVRHIAAPVFDARRTPLFVLTLTSFGRPLKGNAVKAIAVEVTSSADRVHRAIAARTNHDTQL